MSPAPQPRMDHSPIAVNNSLSKTPVKGGGRSAYAMMPPIAENVQGRKDRDSSVSTDNKGDKLGRMHRVETLQQSFVRESKSIKDGTFRNAVREEEKVSWQTPPVIKETIIEASLDDEDPGKYKITTRVKKVKKVKKTSKKEEEEKKRRQREEAERLARERSAER